LIHTKINITAKLAQQHHISDLDNSQFTNVMWHQLINLYWAWWWTDGILWWWTGEMSGLSFFAIQIQSCIFKTQYKSNHHPKSLKFLNSSPNKVQKMIKK